MMPEGVEHSRLITYTRSSYDVTDSMMPEGVEHWWMLL